MTEPTQDVRESGPYEARYRAFIETVSTLRPALHRYCARMAGSTMDGEDVVQEALFEAYQKLDQYDHSRPLKPWLFRIAHNRCIDHLRRRGVRDDAEASAADVEPTVTEPEEVGPGSAVEFLVTALPPKERACILLKDVFDYSLADIADLVDSTVGGVKAALSRARAKLSTVPRNVPRAPSATLPPELRQIMQLYVEAFNRKDWDGVRELISADAQLRVADRFAGRFAQASYLVQYANWPWPWRLALGALDGEPVVMVLRGDGGEWSPHSATRMQVVNGKVTGIADYIHCPWVLRAAMTSAYEDLTAPYNHR